MPGEKTFPSYYPDDWDALEIFPDADEATPPHVSPAPYVALPTLSPASAPSAVQPASSMARAEDPAPSLFPAPKSPWHPNYFDSIKKGRFPALLTRSSVFRVNGARLKASRFGDAPCMGQYELSIRGPFLSLRDKSIWEIAMGFAAKAGVEGDEFPVAMSSFANALKFVDDSSSTMRSIFDALVRLAATELEFDADWGMKGAGNLLASARMEEGTCFISADGGLAPMLTRDYRFELLPERRRSLSSDLARWLHDFVGINAQHEDPFDLAWLRDLTGSSATFGKFAGQLCAALTELSQLPPDAPERKSPIVESFQLVKVGRHAADWKVAITKGDDVRQFTPSPSINIPTMSKKAKQAMRRARVAL